MAPRWKPESSIENAEFRSAYGDMHGHRDARMMEEHVTHMRSVGLVDDKMAIELLKPLDKKREWTEEYLQTHPDYTGQQPDMVPFETAEKHRRARDKEMQKFIEDYDARRIDENGNTVAQDGVNDAAKSGSETSELTDITELEERIEAHPATAGKTLPVRLGGSSSAPAPAVASLAAASLPEPTASEAAPQSKPPPLKRGTYNVEPLEPLSGGEDYQGYRYNQLVAVCRDRGIYSPGDTQGVRNALIQDDINIAQGLPRDIAPYKAKLNLYKEFKTEVPDELKNGGENR